MKEKQATFALKMSMIAKEKKNSSIEIIIQSDSNYSLNPMMVVASSSIPLGLHGVGLISLDSAGLPMLQKNHIFLAIMPKELRLILLQLAPGIRLK